MQPEFTTPPPPVMRRRRIGPLEIGAIVLVFAFAAWAFIPTYLSAKSAAKTADEVRWVKDADLALIYYAADHGDRYPDLSKDIAATLQPYLKDPKTAEAMGRFVWNTRLSGMNARDLHDSNGQVVLYSVVEGTDSVAVGTAGGFARRWRRAYLPEIIAKAKALEPLPNP